MGIGQFKARIAANSPLSGKIRNAEMADSGGEIALHD
jgi:hypothetical protein